MTIIIISINIYFVTCAIHILTFIIVIRIISIIINAAGPKILEGAAFARIRPVTMVADGFEDVVE